MLSPCPNHHAVFDLGGIYIDADYRVRDHTGVALGPLSRKHGQSVSLEHLRHHREQFGYG